MCLKNITAFFISSIARAQKCAVMQRCTHIDAYLNKGEKRRASDKERQRKTQFLNCNTKVIALSKS